MINPLASVIPTSTTTTGPAQSTGSPGSTASPAATALGGPTTSSSSTAATSSTSTVTTSSQGVGGLLNPQTFLQLLVDQLKYQDPLSPTSSSQFVSQVAQLSQVEAVQQLNQELGASSGSEQAMSAASLIGKQVQATGSGGSPVSGVVTSVSLSSGSPVLLVGGSQVPLSEVTEISGSSGGAVG
ncbi:MAG: flagellar biosynthesis protein FlgD [Actinomycetota bacterium]|nr:flagellar biosynthesis protein FlgD [Actinomycetota bacterium]